MRTLHEIVGVVECDGIAVLRLCLVEPTTRSLRWVCFGIQFIHHVCRSDDADFPAVVSLTFVEIAVSRRIDHADIRDHKVSPGRRVSRDNAVENPDWFT